MPREHSALARPPWQAYCSAMDGIHDMGGMQGFGSVVRPGTELAYHDAWEGRVFALSLITGQLGLGAGPGGRARREEMEPVRYLEASYYERWLWSIEQRLLAKGTIEPGEVERMAARIEGGSNEQSSGAGAVTASSSGDAGQAAMMLEALRETEPLGQPGLSLFAVGDRVRVRRMRPAGHTRCPRYVRGATGHVERLQGVDALPDLATYGLDAPVETVYSVAFASEDLWGPSDEGRWTVLLDLWESYLEPAREAG
jgi:nitrile hydratase subunit beta